MLQRLFFIFTFIFSASTYAGEEDLYDFLWLDPDKSVFVLQNKIYPKDKSYYLDLGYTLMNLTSTFQNTSAAQLKAGYYFKEEWAIELSHIQYSNESNSALDSVELVAGLAPFIRRPLNSTTIFAIWSPFYGKINTFNHIYYFDWSFGIGTGVYNMESNLDTAELKDEDRYDEESYTPIQLKSNLKFHLNKNLHLGVEFLNTNYQAPTPKSPNTDKWTNNNDVFISIGVSF